MTVKVFIQNEKGSRLRYRFDERTLKQTGVSELLTEAVYQYGFVPGTVGDDGDCIDCWLISEREFGVGEIIPCRIAGMLEMFEECGDEREEDFKLIGFPEDEEPDRISEEAVEEIMSFTKHIFRKYPEVKISFGKYLSASAAEEFVRNRSATGGDDKALNI